MIFFGLYMVYEARIVFIGFQQSWKNTTLAAVKQSWQCQITMCKEILSVFAEVGKGTVRCLPRINEAANSRIRCLSAPYTLLNTLDLIFNVGQLFSHLSWTHPRGT